MCFPSSLAGAKLRGFEPSTGFAADLEDQSATERDIEGAAGAPSGFGKPERVGPGDRSFWHP